MNSNNISNEYKPISMWGYFGYELLFGIPVIGFIILIVFACGGSSNVNLKNFARSKFCYAILMLLFIIVMTIIIMATGAAETIMDLY